MNVSAQQYKIVFSYPGKADEVILRELGRFRNKTEVVVVSDDREIRTGAKSQGARICRVSEFIRRKQTRSKTSSQAESSDKEISYPLQREITEELRKIWLNDK